MNAAGFNPKVDEYIERSATFAKPILAHLRQLLHKTCPTVVEEIKWGLPHFDYAGEMMCILSASRNHCSFSFWKESIMSDARLQRNPDLQATKRYMGRITSLGDLPPDAELVILIEEAMALNINRVKLPSRAPKTPAVIDMPAEFSAALAAHPAAKAVFDSKSASFRKEYLVWITSAKTEATRTGRIKDALGWISEGKGRFWKYAK